jgi:hypothetical protein
LQKDPAGFAGVIIQKLHNILGQNKNVDSCKDILAQAISKIHCQEEESPSDIIGMYFV